MVEIPSYTLNNGSKIPSIGMGCWMGGPGDGNVYNMCSNALKCGYRHFDTAAGYGNEEAVGKAIRERDSSIPRNEIFLTTKLGNRDHHRVKEAFEQSFEKLFGKVSDFSESYLNLYLMHWPLGKIPGRFFAALVDGKVLSPEEQPTFVETWKEMEELLEIKDSNGNSKVKTIGVSNFSIKNLERLLPHCSIVPATNQVELHPCLPQNELKTYCEAKGILLTAYSPLGQGKTFVENPTIQALAEKNKTTPAQIVISWAVHRGTVAIPKSEDKGRMLANITLVPLAESDMAIVDKLHEGPDMHKSLLAFDNKGDGTVFGWTYEQLGWNLVVGGKVPRD
ncbi:aldo/keto reductase [Mycena vitilis]|nr:aldo/keto reductase [Mycena vitilis]